MSSQRTNKETESKKEPRAILTRGDKIRIAGAALVTLGAFAFLQNKADDATQRGRERMEQEKFEANPKRVLQGTISLHSGVIVRHEPVINDDSGEMKGNIAFQLKEGEKLVVDNPVEVKVEDGSQWFAFSLKSKDGEDTEIYWVKSSALSDQSKDGQTLIEIGDTGLYDSGLDIPQNAIQFSPIAGLTYSNSAIAQGSIQSERIP